MSKTKTKETELQQALRHFEAKAEPILARIAKERDKLRDLISKYEDVLNSVERAEEAFDEGMAALSELL